MSEVLEANRQCGSCSVCCVTLGVPEIEKKAACDCPHRKRGWKACSIYDTRPQSCRDFKCMWLEGYFGAKDKPDLVGCVFQGAYHPDIGPTLTVHESFPGAANNPRVQRIIDNLSRGMAVIIVPPDGTDRKVISKNPETVRRIRDKFARRGIA